MPGGWQLPGEQDTAPALTDLPALRGAFQHIVRTVTRKRPSPNGELRKGFMEEASAKPRQEGK